VEPVYILGDFSLEPQPRGFALRALVTPKIGSWKQQGLPLYGQEMGYRKQFAATAGKTYAVQLQDWKGTVATVKVNGQEAGIIDIPPYALDITRLVKPGNNTIDVIVTGSLKNTLGPHHNKPRPGLVSPWMWRNVNSYPSGSEYDVYDYGLLSEYVISER
jgi:hypothetical protein